MMKPILLMVAMALVSSSAAGAAPRYEGDFGVQWSCGGVGADERRALARLGSEAGIELVMTSGRGAYVAGAEVSLRGTRAKGAQLSGVADGPICLFKLPPGTYRIEATLDGTRRAARAVVRAGGHKPARVVMAFPAKGRDGIRASAEEKRQARAP